METYERSDPAGQKDIESWEQRFAMKMPTDLSAILSRSNGVGLYEKDANKELQVFSTHEAVESFSTFELQKYCPEAIPVSLDGCGNIVVYKKSDSDVVGVYAMALSNLGWEDSKYLGSAFSQVVEMSETVDSVLNS